MPSIIYDPSDEQVEEFALPAVTDWLGYTFTRGEPVEVSDAVAAKLARHPFFSGETAEEPVDPDKLEAVHLGRGKWVIVRGGDKANPVKDGLDKSDAAAFNALSDEDKAAYVAD